MKKYILLVAAFAMTFVVSACGSDPVSIAPIGAQVSPTSPVATVTLPPATVTADAQTVTVPPVTVTVYAPVPQPISKPQATLPLPVKPVAPTTARGKVQEAYDRWCGIYSQLSSEYTRTSSPSKYWVGYVQDVLDFNYKAYLTAKEAYEAKGRTFTPRQLAKPEATAKPDVLIYKYEDAIKKVLDPGTVYLKCE